MKKRTQRFLSLLLSLLMLFSLLPTAAFAATGNRVAPEDTAIPIDAPASDGDSQAPVVAVPAEVESDDPPATLLAETTPIPQYANNIALNKTVYVSNDPSPYKNKAVDGTASGYIGGGGQWIADMKTNTSTTDPHTAQWIVVDLGADHTNVELESIKLWYNGKNWAQNYTLETTDTFDSANPGNSTWTTLATVSRSGVNAQVTNGTGQNIADTANDCDTLTATSVPALTNTSAKRYVRLHITRMNDQCPYNDVGITEFQILEKIVTPDGNLCRPSDSVTVTATASNEEAGTTYTADKTIDGLQTSHWSTDRNAATPSLVIDLGTLRSISSVVSYWCGEGQSAVSDYTISVSNSATGPWTAVSTYSGTVVAVRGETADHTPIYDNFDPVTARYVKIEGTQYNADAGWKCMSLWEVEVYRDHQLPDLSGLPETPSRNLCRPTDGVTVTATASSKEADSVAPANAIDGNTNSDSSRWGSAVGNGPHSLTIDLGTERAVSVVKIFWERRNVLAYTLQGSTDNQNWKTLYTCTREITTTNETLTFNPVAIRYLKVNITSHKSTGIKWDGTESVNWNTVSLFEVEAYRDQSAIPQAASAVLNTIGDDPFIIQDGKLVIDPDITIPEDFTVTFAANLEQVVGADHTIYTPLVKTRVEIDLTVTDNFDSANTASTSAEHPLTFDVPGKYTDAQNAGGNAKPAVIPEIMEWYSHGTDAAYKDQSYTLGDTVRIRYRHAFADVANELKADLEDLYSGITVTLTPLSDIEYSTLSGVMQSGDIVLYDVNRNSPDNRNRVQGYDNETYGMEIYANKIYIYATHPTGAYWATRTLLQGMKLSEDGKSFPNGSLRDYPEFKLRGFVLDVGRKPMSMDMLKAIVKNMAWYKMNDFQVHLNDNLIAMEDYKTTSESWDTDAVYKRADLAYSAFRLQSDIQEEPGAKPLAAKDYHYTKAEYKAFVENSAKLGVSIMSEIDVPAHAKAITDAFPSLQLRGYRGGDPFAQNHPYNDHLDLSTQAKHDASVSKTQEIFDEYLDAGIFGSAVDFGADEYYASGTPYRRYVKDMITYLKEKKATNPALANLTIRQWGSLTQMSSSEAGLTDADLKPIVDDVQLNLWNTGWANPTQMYNLGYDLINTVDGQLYIVPKAGYYFDYIPHSRYNSWTPNNFGGTWLPASSDQVIGAAYALWNDCIDTQANGISEQEVFDRFFDILPYLSVKMWGEGAQLDRPLAEAEANVAILGTAPGTNPYYKVAQTDFFTYDFTDRTDKTGNGHTLTLNNAEINSSRSLLVLKGGASYAETGLDRLGFGNQLSFRALKLTYSDQEEILFEGDHAYGDFSIKALPVEGKTDVWTLGFSRELYDYEFEGVELPLGQWVSLTLTNAPQSTTLSVDGGAPVAAVGKFVSKPDSNTQFWGNTGITNSSFELPVARIGSKTKAFNGYLAAVTTGEPISVPDAFITATAPSEQKSPNGEDPVEGPASYAVDGDLNTMWHSNYSGDSPNNPNDLSQKDDKRYIQLNIATPVTVRGLSYTPRANAGNGTVTSYRIEVSTDGETFTSVANGDWERNANKKTVTFDAPQSDIIAVRLYGVTTYSNNQYMSALEVELDYDDTIVLSNTNTDIKISNVTWDGDEATADVSVALLPSNFPLEEGTDYTVTTLNITAAGQATVTIAGKDGSNYSGSVTATFTVPAKPAEPVNISTATVTFAQTSYPLENGKAEPAPIVKLGSATLMRGLDYTVTYTNNTRAGTATATITGVGDYTGTKTATFTVVPAIVKKNLSDASKTKVTLHQTSFPYEGEAIRPEVVVTFNGEALTLGRDYTVSYTRNNAVGTGTVTVTGVAPYCEGSASATFTIVDPATAKNLSDRAKTTVTFAQQSYDLVNGKAEPEPTVRYEGKRLTKGTDYTVSYLNNTSGGIGVAVIHGIGDYMGSFAATFTINSSGENPGSNTGSGSGSGSGSNSGSNTPSAGLTTIQTTKGDGVTTTIKTAPSGAMTAQSSYDDGTKVSADIPVTGPVTAVVTVPSRVDQVTVTIPTRGEPAPGQVAVILHPDGTEEIVKTSLPTENGLELTLDASAIVQVVDNTKTFVDVPADSWATEAIQFVTSREIFNGTGNSTFSPSSDMSRAMVCTVLANLAGEDTKGGVTWYEKGLDWATANHVSDGSNPHDIVTREQLASMLYRYAGSPLVINEVPRRFHDRDQVSEWAELAMTWAVENDLIRGRNGTDLAPSDTATRAEVAAVLQRYVALISK